jgi:hypothetical protein
VLIARNPEINKKKVEIPQKLPNNPQNITGIFV